MFYKHICDAAGIGVGMVIVSALVAVYYNMIIAWSFFYLFASFTSDLPWQYCDRDYNTPCKHAHSICCRMDSTPCSFSVTDVALGTCRKTFSSTPPPETSRGGGGSHDTKL